MLAGGILDGTDDGSGVDGAMEGTVLGIADALAASGVELVQAGDVAGADGGEGLDGDADEAELQEAGPAGPAGWGGGSAPGEQGRGDGRRSRLAHGIVSGVRDRFVEVPVNLP
jgi:hypothetical protein